MSTDWDRSPLLRGTGRLHGHYHPHAQGGGASGPALKGECRATTRTLSPSCSRTLMPVDLPSKVRAGDSVQDIITLVLKAGVPVDLPSKVGAGRLHGHHHNRAKA